MEGASVEDARNTRQVNIITNIKSHIPSDKTPLLHLSDGNCDHAGDAGAMAGIIKGFLGNFWSKRRDAPSSSEIEDFLSFYTKTFPSSPELAPKIPGVADIKVKLKHTNNSAHGVDGVPFSAYRAFPDISAPIIHGILLNIGNGGCPPSDFNIGRRSSSFPRMAHPRSTAPDLSTSTMQSIA